MRVALIQMDSTENKELNVRKALNFIEEAVDNRANFVSLPEYFSFRARFKTAEQIKSVSENIPGCTTNYFMKLARIKKVNILLGSLYEKVPGHSKVYNSSVFINSRGQVEAVYRKQNLFCASVDDKEARESDVCIAGTRRQMVSIGDFTMGMTVCFDLRFSSLYQAYCKQGVNLFAVPSSFVYKTGRSHWEILLRARAIETMSYIIAPNQIGVNEYGVKCWGHSMLIDPWGEVIAEASLNKEEILYGFIDIKRVISCRKSFPTIFGNRKF